MTSRIHPSCNCATYGSALHCPVHTQADFEAADRARRRKFEGEVLIEIEMDGDEDAAFNAIDQIMQAAWDRTQGGTTIGGPTWHFTMLDGAVADVTEER
jgi:hypothetical protein